MWLRARCVPAGCRRTVTPRRLLGLGLPPTIPCCEGAFQWLGGWSAQYAKVIQRLEFPATFKDFKVQNIVGSCDVRFPIRLEGLAYSHGMFCSVRPPLNPLLFCLQA